MHVWNDVCFTKTLPAVLIWSSRFRWYEKSLSESPKSDDKYALYNITYKDEPHYQRSGTTNFEGDLQARSKATHNATHTYIGLNRGTLAARLCGSLRMAG